jgi:TonB family protein
MKARNVKIIRSTINFVAALLLAAILFAALPGLRPFVSPKSQENVIVLVERKPALEIKKEENKPRRMPVQIVRTIQTQARTSAERTAKESFTFAPDLGVQGSGDVAAPDRRQVKSQIFNEEETDVRPVLASRTMIPYPPEAQKDGIEGVVDLELLVDESGRVIRVNFNQLPSELFRSPVTSTVMRWRFKPAQVKGVAVSVRVRQKITFTLSQTTN